MAKGVRGKQKVTRSERPARATRVWPPLTSRLVCLLLIVAGPFGVVASIAFGFPLAAPVFALLTLLGARLIGWVEIDDNMLRHRRLMGTSTEVRFSDVSEVGIGMHQVRKSKWWYPEVATTDGSSVKFLMLKTLSGQKNLKQVEKIFEECLAHSPPEEEDQFTTVTTAGELEFQLSPGYDDYLREKAEREAAGLPIGGPLELVPPLSPAELQVPERHLRTGGAIAIPAADSLEDAPEVFDPAPMTYSGKPERHLSAVPEPEAVVLQPEAVVLQPPPIPQRLPTLIEQPTESVAPPTQVSVPDRGFRSLFSRAA